VPGETQVDKDNIPGVSLTDICAGLVVVDKGTNLVRLVHYTTQEYFDRERERPFPLAESLLARTCLTYPLSLVDEDSLEKGWDRRSVSMDYPFLTYAICHWWRHAYECVESDSELRSLAVKLLGRERTWFDLIITPGGLPRTDELEPWGDRHYWLGDRPSGLEFAAMYGWVNVCRDLIVQQTTFTTLDGDGETALHWAAWFGQLPVVETLLAHGVKVEAVAPLFRSTALVHAARNGHTSVCRYLLDRNANVSAICRKRGQTALYEATFFGRTEVVRLLLERGAAVDGSNGVPVIPLAAQLGHFAIIEILIDKGADLSLFGRSILFAAVYAGHRKLVDILVDKGVQLEFDVGEAIEWSNICHAVRRGSLAEVKNLTQGGAPLNFHGIGRKATIDIAIESGDGSIIEYLVANGSRGRLGWNFESSAIKRWAKEPWFPHLQTLLVSDRALKTESRIECRTWSEEKEVRIWRDSPHEPYVEAYFPADLLSLDRIVFRTESHDQGQSITTSSLFAGG
jgi:ankyrin repeat protein